MGRLLPVALLLFLCSAPSGGLVLRKRSTVETNDQNRLIEALKVIERERRRLADGYDVTGYESSPAEKAWQPEGRGDYETRDDLSNRFDTDFMRRLLDVVDDNGNDVNSDDVSIPAGQSYAEDGGDETDTDAHPDIDDDTVADMESSPTEPIVDPAELKSIFQPSESEDEDNTDEAAEEVEKKTLPYQLGGPPAPEPEQKRQQTIATYSDDAEVAPSGESQEIERLFEEAAVIDALSDVTQPETEGRPLDDVHVKETEQILPDGTTEITRQRFDEEVVPGWGNEPVLSKEWATEREDFNSEPTIVRKRSESWSDANEGDDETSARLVGESLGTPVDGDITRYLAYEDAEIDNLAKALDLSTRSQLEKTDKYIPEEILHLRRAIEYEGTLDRLRESNDAGVNLAADGSSNDIRQEPDYENSETDQPFTQRDSRFTINNDVSGDASRDKADTSRLDDYIAVLLRGFVPKEQEDESVARKPSLKEWLEAGPETSPVDQELETEWYLNPLLRRILEDYKVGRLQKRAQRVSQGQFGQLEDGIGDLQDMESNIAGSDQDSYAQTQLARAYQAEQAERAILSQFADVTADVCPAVIEMTDNCAVARDKGLILDDEALDLCNRHQLCYACGAAHGLTRHNCDEGYLNESNQLCGADTDNQRCATDVIKLYVVMLSKHHPVSSSSTPDICSSTCTIDYIIGVANRI